MTESYEEASGPIRPCETTHRDARQEYRRQCNTRFRVAIANLDDFQKKFEERKDLSDVFGFFLFDERPSQRAVETFAEQRSRISPAFLRVLR